MRTVTKEDLIRDLRALGVREGMKLQVHSSLSRIGWVEGGADAVLDALMTVVTPEGTLMLPSFNHGAASTRRIPSLPGAGTPHGM